ncbi:hypothetical protein HCG68_18530 [Paeniclostridium sordellii]|nr:hypothetical protein [Paeniclostridium sordellii]
MENILDKKDEKKKKAKKLFKNRGNEETKKFENEDTEEFEIDDLLEEFYEESKPKNMDINFYKDKSKKIKSKKLKYKKDNYTSCENNIEKFEDGKFNKEYFLCNYVKKSLDIIYMRGFRIYDDKYGYFKYLDDYSAKTFIYSKIPEFHKKKIRYIDVVNTLNLLKIDSDIQHNPEFVPENINLINCENCVIKLDKEGILNIKKHKKKYMFLSYIKASYKENISIKNTNFKLFLKTITQDDKDLEMLIQEVMGYCFSNYRNAKKAFILYGKSNSGKSVLLNILTAICGEENVSNIELQDLSRKEYTAELFGKSINICSELQDKDIKDTGIFKALVSETDKVVAKPLYKQPFSFYNKAKLIFATNNLPSINSKINIDNTAFFNRLVLIPFLYSVPENQQDRNLYRKLLEEKDIIFSWAIKGLVRYIKNGFSFSYCKLSQDIINQYVKSNNIVETFIEECCEKNNKYHAFKYNLEYEFKEFCLENGLNNIKREDYSFLKDTLINKYGYDYRRINKNGENKYGFIGLKITR